MNIHPLAFGALLLAGCLLGNGLAAAPYCPDGQVWDRKNQRCVSQRTTWLPDAGPAEYARSLASHGREAKASGTT